MLDAFRQTRLLRQPYATTTLAEALTVCDTLPAGLYADDDAFAVHVEDALRRTLMLSNLPAGGTDALRSRLEVFGLLERLAFSTDSDATARFEEEEAATAAAVALDESRSDWRFGLRAKVLQSASKTKRRPGNESGGDTGDAPAAAADGGESQLPLATPQPSTLRADAPAFTMRADAPCFVPVAPTVVSAVSPEALVDSPASSRRKRNKNSAATSAASAPSPAPILYPKGPKGPDGTRGFSMGRGKPIMPVPQPGG